MLGQQLLDVLRRDKDLVSCVYIFFVSRHDKDLSLFDLINIIAKSDRGALVAVHQPSCVDAVFLLTFASP